MTDELMALLPCPFCGETASAELDEGFVVIRCPASDCRASTGMFSPGLEAEAIAAWNRRNELPAMIAERDALREALTAHNVKCANGEVATIADALETAAGTLDCFRDADAEAAPNGLLDCIDNDGNAYQSEWMAGLMDHALISSKELRKWATTLRAALGASHDAG